jgi:hypothetical protein
MVHETRLLYVENHVMKRQYERRYMLSPMCLSSQSTANDKRLALKGISIFESHHSHGMLLTVANPVFANMETTFATWKP